MLIFGCKITNMIKTIPQQDNAVVRNQKRKLGGVNNDF